VYLSSRRRGKDRTRCDLFHSVLVDKDLETYGGGLFGSTIPTLV
jgi:hypothetical protein